MNGILRWRTPAVVVALLALAVTVLVRLTEFRAALVDGAGAPRSEAFPTLAPGANAYALSVVVAALLVSCWVEPAVEGRPAFTLVGALLTAACFFEGLVPLAVAVRSLPFRTMVGVALTPLAALALPLLACSVLVVAVLSRGSSVPTAELEAPVAAEPETVARSEVEEPDPQQQPTWATDAAAGAVWRSAGDAARGVPGGAWGSADGNGWSRAAEATSLPAIGTGPDTSDTDSPEDERPTAVR